MSARTFCLVVQVGFMSSCQKQNRLMRMPRPFASVWHPHTELQVFYIAPSNNTGLLWVCCSLSYNNHVRYLRPEHSYVAIFEMIFAKYIANFDNNQESTSDLNVTTCHRKPWHVVMLYWLRYLDLAEKVLFWVAEREDVRRPGFLCQKSIYDLAQWITADSYYRSCIARWHCFFARPV